MRRLPEPPMVVLVDVMTVLIFILIFMVSRSHPFKSMEPGIVLPPRPFEGAVIVRRGDDVYRRRSKDGTTWVPYVLPQNSMLVECAHRWDICSADDAVLIQGETLIRIGMELLHLYDSKGPRVKRMMVFLDERGKIARVQYVPQNSQK